MCAYFEVDGVVGYGGEAFFPEVLGELLGSRHGYFVVEVVVFVSAGEGYVGFRDGSTCNGVHHFVPDAEAEDDYGFDGWEGFFGGLYASAWGEGFFLQFFKLGHAEKGEV